MRRPRLRKTNATYPSLFVEEKKTPNLSSVSTSPGITPETRKVKRNHGMGGEQDIEMGIVGLECCEREMGKMGRGREGPTGRKGGEGIHK